MKSLWLVLSFCVMSFCAEAEPSLDLSTLSPGQMTTLQWFGKPVLVYKRTPEEVLSLKAQEDVDALYERHHSDAYFLFARTFGADMAARLKPFNDSLKKSPFRSVQDNVLVVLGQSTRFGCYVELGQNANAFMDGCSGAEYGLDGRITVPTQRERFHLLIPPYQIEDGRLILIETDPDPQLVKQMMPDFDKLDMTPGEKLMELLQWNQFDLAEQLLGPDVLNYRTATGATPLHLAAFRAPTALLEKLLDLGFDPNATTSNGATPLQMALLRNQLENARLLISRGAKTDAESAALMKKLSAQP